MPGGDGTGPLGLGPRTGRVAGYCAGCPVPGYRNPMAGRWAGYPAPGYGYAAAPGYLWARPLWGRGRGLGRGRGWGRGAWGGGRGFGRGFGRGGWARPWAFAGYPPAYGVPPYGWPQPTPEQEADALKRQAEFLQGQLEAIRTRLDGLAKEPAKD